MNKLHAFAFVLVVVVGVIAVAATPARANGIVVGCGTSGGGIFTCSQPGGDLSATVTFAESGGDLLVTLSNTSTMDVLGASDILTAVFFSIAGLSTMTPDSAILSGGSQVLALDKDTGEVITITAPSGDVGGEWAYLDQTFLDSLGAPKLDDAPGNPDFGISEVGFSSVGFGDIGVPLFLGGPAGGPNLDGPVEVNGPPFGIAPAIDDPSTYGGGKITPLIHDSVDFTLYGALAGYTVTDTYNVNVAFGSSLPLVVPEPSTLLLLGSGLAGLGLWNWRRRGSRHPANNTSNK